MVRYGLRVTAPDHDRDHHEAANYDLLRQADELEATQQDAMLRWIPVAGGQRVLEVGSGAGGLTARAAAMVGPGGAVTGVDVDAESVALTRRTAAEAGVADRVTVRQADVLSSSDGVLADLGTFDVVVARAMVHHLPDQLEGVRRLLTPLKPGGVFALGEGGLPNRFLPFDLGIGDPGLGGRLDAARDRWFAGMREELAGHAPWPSGWGALLEAAGLTQIRTCTFAFDAPAPPGSLAHGLCRGRLESAAEPARAAFLDQADRDTLAILLDPAHPLGIDRRTDLHLITARSLHVGTLPGADGVSI